MAISLNLYVLLGLLELLIVLVVLGVMVTFQWRAAKRKAEALSKELHNAKNEIRMHAGKSVVKPGGEAPESLSDYSYFLREQLEQSSIMLGDAPQIQTDQDAENPADVTRQMLAARHQFLQLELDVQSLSAERSVEAQRKSVVEGMQALLAGLATHAEAQPETDEAAADAAAEVPVSTSLNEEQKLRGQVEFLRNVVSNQHDVMHELRQLLEEHDSDSDKLQAAMRKLGDAEKQGKALQRHLDELEDENALKKRAEGKSSGKQMDAASPDSDMLRDLVGNQQRTIGNLQNLLRNLPSDSGKTKELDDIINKIQRTNNDLSSCVMVLEDENDNLRERVESLQKHIADLESPAVSLPASVAVAAAAAVDTGAVSAQVPATDVKDSDVDDVQEAASTSAPAKVDLAEGEDGIDALLDKVAADAKAKPAESAVANTFAAAEKPAAVESTQTDSIGMDDVDDIDALLDKAAADAKAKPAEPEPAIDVDPTEGVSADDDFDVDALLAASAPATAKDEKKSRPAPITAKPPSLTQGEAEQDDIDALLADLFADDNKVGDGSKS